MTHTTPLVQADTGRDPHTDAVFQIGDRVSLSYDPATTGTIVAHDPDPAHASCCPLVLWDGDTDPHAIFRRLLACPPPTSAATGAH